VTPISTPAEFHYLEMNQDPYDRLAYVRGIG